MTEKRCFFPWFEGNVIGIRLKYYKKMTSSKLPENEKFAPFFGAVIGYSVDGGAPDPQKVKEE